MPDGTLISDKAAQNKRNRENVKRRKAQHAQILAAVPPAALVAGVGGRGLAEGANTTRSGNYARGETFDLPFAPALGAGARLLRALARASANGTRLTTPSGAPDVLRGFCGEPPAPLTSPEVNIHPLLPPNVADLLLTKHR